MRVANSFCAAFAPVFSLVYHYLPLPPNYTLVHCCADCRKCGSKSNLCVPRSIIRRSEEEHMRMSQSCRGKRNKQKPTTNQRIESVIQCTLHTNWYQIKDIAKRQHNCHCNKDMKIVWIIAHWLSLDSFHIHTDAAVAQCLVPHWTEIRSRVEKMQNGEIRRKPFIFVETWPIC